MLDFPFFKPSTVVIRWEHCSQAAARSISTLWERCFPRRDFHVSKTVVSGEVSVETVEDIELILFMFEQTKRYGPVLSLPYGYEVSADA